MGSIVLWSDQELPSTPVTWRDSDGVVVDFSSGWTFTFEASKNGAVVLSKTSGITGAATAPNVTIDWAVDELAAVTADTYSARLIARRVADSKDRVFPDRIDFQIQAKPV